MLINTVQNANAALLIVTPARKNFKFKLCYSIRNTVSLRDTRIVKLLLQNDFGLFFVVYYTANFTISNVDRILVSKSE